MNHDVFCTFISSCREITQLHTLLYFGNLSHQLTCRPLLQPERELFRETSVCAKKAEPFQIPVLIKQPFGKLAILHFKHMLSSKYYYLTFSSINLHKMLTLKYFLATGGIYGRKKKPHTTKNHHAFCFPQLLHRSWHSDISSDKIYKYIDLGGFFFPPYSSWLCSVLSHLLVRVHLGTSWY